MTAKPMRLSAPIYVSRPILPPLEEFVSDLEEIWASHLLTNMGPFHLRFERELHERLGLGHVTLWNNGTTALLAALAALKLSGEVIVTPFTFPATVHAIAAVGLTPVFADIDDDTMTLDPERVRERISPSTSAIVGTHIYGNFCDTLGLAEVADEHSLRIVYDGAHSFGSHQPVFPHGAASLGDITMLSFHATKLFHSVEGGALVTQDPMLNDRLTLIRNFGIRSEDVVEGIGLNGKMSELHAAIGLRVLSRLDGEIDRRAELGKLYAKRLASIPGLSVVSGTGRLCSIVLRVDEAEFGTSRDDLHAALRELNIISRRYFYPLCSEVAPYSLHPSAHCLPSRPARRRSAGSAVPRRHGRRRRGSDLLRDRVASCRCRMTDPQVSVLLVTYNHAAFIDRALASIASQRFDGPLEVVVADDASDDDTVARIAQWAEQTDFDVRVLPEQPRLGITQNYYRGFVACRGAYIAVLEGDDEWISENKLALQVQLLGEHPDLSMTATRILLYDDLTGSSSVLPLIGLDAMTSR